MIDFIVLTTDVDQNNTVTLVTFISISKGGNV